MLSSLTRALVFSGALDEATAVHAQALAMARRLGDPGTIAAALRSVATARWLPQQFAARMQDAREAEDLAERSATGSACSRRRAGACST